MKLEGLVEDIHLDEVLRVLAVAGRSGTLWLDAQQTHGFITLSRGRVLAARVDEDRQTVGDVLVAAQLLPAALLANLPDARRREPIPGCLTGVLPPERMVQVHHCLQRRLVRLSLRLLSVERGRFRFVLNPNLHPVACYLGDQGMALLDGVSAVQVVQEARQGGTGEESDQPAPTPNAQPAPAADAGPPVDLVVVDDDPDTLAAVEERLKGLGLSALVANSAATGASLLLDQHHLSPHTVAVVDLVMPRADGKGILGGLDLCRRLRAHEPPIRVILASDVENTDAEARARELGVASVVRKPEKSRIREEKDLSAFMDAVLAVVGLSDRAGSVDIASEVLAELGESAKPERAEPKEDNAVRRHLEMLRSMIGPLNDPEQRDEIPLMILRVAASTFGRAALFLVTERELVGLGGFGLDAVGRDPGRTLRDTHIPLDADTVLAVSLRERRPTRQQFFESEWNRYLAERLGGPVPTEAFVAPVMSSRQVEAVLYCDNAVDGHPLGDTQVLEIFLTQAGAAMERAALELRLLQQAQPGVA